MMLRPARLLALTTALLLSPSVALAATAPTEEANDAQLLLLLDASRSMEDPDAQGEPKIDAARAALHDVVDSLDPSQSVGLRVFGGAVPLDQPTEDKCADSELVVPVGTGNTDQLSAAVDGYAPLGETPIAHALQQAANDLGPEGNRTVLLVSDGIATCDPDPCEVAEQLTADGFDLVVHTVGLGADDETRGQLQCIAGAAGGTYYDATDTESLTTALTRVSNRAFRPFTVQGTPVEGTTDPATSPEIAPEGQYTDTFGVPEQPKYYTIRRTSPGAAILVGVSAQPEFGATGMAELRLETADGERCASNRFFAGTDIASTSVMSGSVHLEAAGPDLEDADGCQTADELQLVVMTVERYTATEGVPFEMLVRQTAALADAPLPEVGSLPAWTPMEATGAPQEIVPGTSFNDAAPVTPGTSYAVDVMPGEVLFFTAPATFGQAVQMRVDSDPAQMSQAQLESLGSHGRLLVRDIYTPERGEILNLLRAQDGIGDLDGDGNMIVSPSRPESAATSSGQIRFSNREHAEKPFTEGDYYLAIAFAPGSSGVPVPLTLTFDVVGEAVAGPQRLEGGITEADPSTSVPTEEAAKDVVSETSAAAPTAAGSAPEAVGTTDGEAGMPWPWILGGAGVLVAAAGGVMLVARTRDRTTDA